MKSSTTPLQPPSPTSSRSRPRQRKRSSSSLHNQRGEDSNQPSCVKNSSKRKADSNNNGGSNESDSTKSYPPPYQSSVLTIDQCPILPSIRQIGVHNRSFGKHIQRIVHAFGEIRYCAREVLEYVEDTTRATILHLIRKHNLRNIGDVTKLLISSDLNGNGNVLHSGVISRLKVTLKHSTPTPEAYHALIDNLHSQLMLNCAVNPRKPWDHYSTLAFLNSNNSEENNEVKQEKQLQLHWQQRILQPDSYYMIAWAAKTVYMRFMTESQYRDCIKCKETTFISPESPTSVKTFTLWLGNTITDYNFSNDTLLYLSHLAYEIIGTLTQKALHIRYHNDVASGHSDARAANWSPSRHLLAALNHGLCAGALIPMTEGKAKHLVIELNHVCNYYSNNSDRAGFKWIPHQYATSPCLLPMHMSEAFRRLSTDDGHPLFT